MIVYECARHFQRWTFECKTLLEAVQHAWGDSDSGEAAFVEIRDGDFVYDWKWISEAVGKIDELHDGDITQAELDAWLARTQP